jgi:hypothetical protein
MPIRTEGVPGTIRRSPEKVRRTYSETLDSAHEQYGGDHWELKDRPGPSDDQDAQRGAAARHHPKPTAGGVDVRGHTRYELYERARRAGVKGRSRMNKLELAQAIARRNG